MNPNDPSYPGRADILVDELGNLVYREIKAMSRAVRVDRSLLGMGEQYEIAFCLLTGDPEGDYPAGRVVKLLLGEE